MQYCQRYIKALPWLRNEDDLFLVTLNGLRASKGSPSFLNRSLFDWVPTGTLFEADAAKMSRVEEKDLGTTLVFGEMVPWRGDADL